MMMQRIIPICLTLLAAVAVSHANEIDLQGQWRFKLDRADTGIEQRWFDETLPDELTLPGSLQSQGFSDPPSKYSDWTGGIGIRLFDDARFKRYIESDHFQCPYWLTPDRHYVGTAWYQRDVEIPGSWSGRRIVLFLERPHWETTLWVNGQQVGQRDGLGVPHKYDLTEVLKPGPNSLTIRVDNRVVIPVGNDAHSVSDQTQGNWNGIVGALRLIATNKVWIDDVQVYPDVSNRQVRLLVKIGNHTGLAGGGVLTAQAETTNADPSHVASSKSWPVKWAADGAEVEVVYPLGDDSLLWDEFTPNVYRLSLELREAEGADKLLANSETTYGLREFGIDGTQFTINGQRIFLRGTLECCVFPETGYPATDVAAWKRIIRICQAHGLNHIRFHSWCPPQAAFVAADELGMLFQIECSAWASFGDGTAVDDWIHHESARMLKEYGNHPSFMLMAASNEAYGRNRAAVLEPLVRSWIAKDPRHFYTCGAGWPHLPANQFHINQEARLQRFIPLKLDHPPQNAADYRRLIGENDIPIVTHEIGQWCAYPNPAERLKYTGYLKAENIDIFRDLLDRAGMLDQAGDFLLASGKFQAMLYKQGIEAALRTPGQAGFQLLSLQDFPGQGTAPVGVLDALWGPKGYITAEEYRRFCNHTVALARLPRFVWTTDETFEAGVDVTNYGPADMPDAEVNWRLATPAGRIYTQGSFAPSTLLTGNVNSVGEVTFPLANVKTPCQLIFSLDVTNTSIENQWPIWVYPSKVDTDVPASVHVITNLEETIQALDRGQRVLFRPRSNTVRGNTLGTYRPIFWNRVTFPSQQEHTLGVLCQADHPAFDAFPTSFYSDWKWWELFERSKPIVLKDVPQELRPMIQPIDDWNDCRRLSFLFEARVGSGSLIVCSMDLESDLADRPVARQLRHSLFSYMSSDQFSPACELTSDQLGSLFKEPTAVQRLEATVAADSQEPLHEAGQALDDNPRTIWCTAWTPTPVPMPHHIVLDLKQSVKLNGFTYLPRQDMSRGRIAKYEVLVSVDGTNWSSPIAQGTWQDNAEMKSVRFDEPQHARYVKLVARSEVNGQAFATAAEIGVLLDP